LERTVAIAAVFSPAVTVPSTVALDAEVLVVSLLIGEEGEHIGIESGTITITLDVYRLAIVPIKLLAVARHREIDSRFNRSQFLIRHGSLVIRSTPRDSHAS
jgi:hypothetical protein